MRYAFVNGGVVQEAWSRDPFELFDPGYAGLFVSCPDEVQQGWTFDGTTWAEPATANAAVQARAKRDALLRDSDWTQLPDAPVDRAAWAAYRQALREVPLQPGFPASVTWPKV